METRRSSSDHSRRLVGKIPAGYCVAENLWVTRMGRLCWRRALGRCVVRQAISKMAEDLFMLGYGGGGGIRTPGTLAGPTVFKTARFDRSRTPPFLILSA